MTEKRFADLAVQLWYLYKKYEQQRRVVLKHRNRPARLREESKKLRKLEKQFDALLWKFNEAWQCAF